MGEGPRARLFVKLAGHELANFTSDDYFLQSPPVGQPPFPVQLNLTTPPASRVMEKVSPVPASDVTVNSSAVGTGTRVMTLFLVPEATSVGSISCNLAAVAPVYFPPASVA